MERTSPPLALQAPDLAQARQFLQAIDPDPAAQFGFRTCDDRGDDHRLAVKAFGTLDLGVRQSNDPAKHGKSCLPSSLLTYMQSKGAGVFAAINKLDGQGQRAGNVISIRALFADADSRLEVERLRAFIAKTDLVPTVMVASGGIHEDTEKLQCHWRIAGCPVASFTEAQLTLISRIGTDPAVHDRSRIMRLPGYWHQKREPRQSRIVEFNPAVEYEFDTFLARVSAQPQIVDPRAGSSSKCTRTSGARVVAGSGVAAGPTMRLRVLLGQYGGLVTPAIRALLREAHAPAHGQPGNRHETLKSIVARCVHARWSDEEIRTLVQPIIKEWQDSDWPDDLDRILDWTRRQEEAARVAATAGIAFGAACNGEIQ